MGPLPTRARRSLVKGHVLKQAESGATEQLLATQEYRSQGLEFKELRTRLHGPLTFSQGSLELSIFLLLGKTERKIGKTPV